MSSYYTGWLLPDAARHKLLAMFPPLFPEAIGHHVTLQFPAKADTPLPSAISGEVYGYSTDGNSLECLIVRIGATTERPDGRTYHITWSLDRTKGARPFKSNAVIKQFGVERLYPPVPIDLVPTLFSTSATLEENKKAGV